MQSELCLPRALSAVDFFCFFFFLLYISFIEVQLIYNVVSISAVQQSDSVIHIQTFKKIFLVLISDVLGGWMELRGP